MNAGACPNQKCDAFIEFNSINKFPVKCSKCSEEVSENDHQQFKEIMHATRVHLDSLKSSKVACKHENLRT